MLKQGKSVPHYGKVSKLTISPSLQKLGWPKLAVSALSYLAHALFYLAKPPPATRDGAQRKYEYYSPYQMTAAGFSKIYGVSRPAQPPVHLESSIRLIQRGKAAWDSDRQELWRIIDSLTEPTMDISSAKNPKLFSTESRAAAVIVGVIVLLLIPSVAVALRFYTRRGLTGRVSYDDWISLVTLVSIAPGLRGDRSPVISPATNFSQNLGFACGITIAYMTRVGLGHHIGAITQSQGIQEYLQAFYLSVVFYNAGIMFVKLSFLAMYYRAMKAPMWRKVVAFVSVVVFAWEVTQVFAAIFFCKPFPSHGHGEEASSHVKCIPYLPEWYQTTAGNIALNTIILLLSIPMIRSMELPGVQKLALGAIFCLGLFTLATSIIRIKFLGLYIDTTFDNVDAAMWSLCEISAGLTCACLPTLRPLAARYFPRHFSYQRAGLRVLNRQGKAIPPPLPLHQRPMWYGADSPTLGIYTGVPLKSGKTVARSITTELSSATVMGEDDYHEVQKQRVHAADSLKPHHHMSMQGSEYPATTATMTTTTRPQRPPQTRLISDSSLRRHSTPEGPADRTEIIVIGLQCPQLGDGHDFADGGGNAVVQQPESVYRGWRNSEVVSFGTQQQYGPRETRTTASAATVPVVLWDEEKDVLPRYHNHYHYHPDSAQSEQQSRGADTHNHNMDIQYRNEGEGGPTTTRSGGLVATRPDTPNITQWYADASRAEEANLDHIQDNSSNSRRLTFWRWQDRKYENYQ
ncbi:hypothetical protein PG993_006074 [Apiospora rasikravindrae]|uniref:Rhodopsin domain-containing protein n=1 Tax=Apiospora rasikravindrae TaxID=990691 RepID=A0ABR1TAL2_9PEZI